MADETTVAEEETSESVQKVYIGPSIPRCGLRTAQILTGTEADIASFIGKYTERFPELKYLIVDLADLNEAMKKVKTKGNILHKYYQDAAAKSKASRRG